MQTLLQASMGPRSDNRGYGLRIGFCDLSVRLQWVHGPITVVMQIVRRWQRPASDASMGPRSDNRGYVEIATMPLHAKHGFNGSTVR